ncbi:MAG: hypothetical protein EXR54_02525 [Dehalococcoidia bacterium]|nr:hypothetical protein [Dehalococcoidia bacterium]MSQ16432.1 hypothetical protein [Dehalococcoidia bacterium]
MPSGLSCLIIFLLLLGAACGPAAPTPTPLPSSPEVGVIVITSDIAMGANRVVFGLVDRDGFPVRPPAGAAGQTPQAQVRALFLPPGQAAGEVRATATAQFLRWPAGEQGIYAAKLAFDRVGFWELEVTAARADGTPVVAKGAVQVKEKTFAPNVGDPAPRSNSPTAGQVTDLSTITSSNRADPDLYRLSIAQALDAGKPLVVVFATPAFCVSATCGPQVEVLSELKDRYREQANFIHVEVFQDPHLLKGGRVQGKTAPAVTEWGLPTEPWTFVIDRAGKVHARFEQFSTVDEVAAALQEVL